MFLKKLFISLVTLVLSLEAFSLSDETLFEIERKIEKHVTELIGNQIPINKYYVIVSVKMPPEKKDAKNAQDSSKNMPYSSLKLDQDFLDNMFTQNRKDNFFAIPIEIELLFDKSVSAELQTVIVNKLKKNLRLDDKTRIVKVSTIQLEFEEQMKPTESFNIQLESEKLKFQQSEIQREKDAFESTKKGADLEEKVKESELAMQKLKEEVELEKKKAAEELIKEKEKLAQEAKEALVKPTKNVIEQLESLQIVVFGVIAGLSLLLFAFINASAQKKSSKSVSQSIAGVGESIVNASQQLKPQSEGASGGAPGEGGEAGAGGGISVSGSEMDDSGERARLEQFLNLVEEKIEVLSNEGNFNFYRHFLDFIEDDITLASAILVAVKTDTARKLLENVAPEYISLVRTHLTEAGALSKAKKNRRQALEDFYGRIAMDEYLNSPLLQIKELSWLTSLSTNDLLDLVLKVDDVERRTFFACLTPTRLTLLLEKAADAAQRKLLLEAIKEVDMVTYEDIEGIFAKIQEKSNQLQESKKEKAKTLIDGPQFFAKMIMDLSPENREEMMTAISYRSELLEAIKQYYIPFETVALLTTKIIKDIFAKRPTQQVAIAIFKESDAIKEKVISSMPDALQSSLREEIETLVADSDNEAQNKKKALVIQDEVCRFLLNLNRDGLLEYADKDGKKGPGSANKTEYSGAA